MRIVRLSVWLLCAVSAVWAQTQQAFITITPCRLVDTRNAAGTFGGPALVGSAARNFPVWGNCGVPSSAVAYALNVTVVPPGPLIFLTVWPGGTDQPNVSTLNAFAGQVVANAAIVPAGADGSINVYASNPTDVIIDINGYFAPVAVQTETPPPSSPPGIDSGTQNTGIGIYTLALNAGSLNTAMGANVLSANSTGNNNSGVGADALLGNTSGSANTAVGGEALTNNLIGNDNTAVGFSALWANVVGLSNTALGSDALYSNPAGSYNVAVGQGALYASTGGNNVAVGYQAGAQATSGANNIFISNVGQASDNAAIRIGTAGTQTSAFLAGVSGSTVSGAAVLVDSNGQLGVASSSLRFKEDIQPIGDASDALMLLRPVEFRYKKAQSDGKKPLEYGLIGEEVQEIYPELVLHDRDGEVESLKYHELPVLLLNELQKQHKTIEELEARIAALEAELKTRQGSK